LHLYTDMPAICYVRWFNYGLLASFLYAAAAANPSSSTSGVTIFRSGAAQVALLELYTSEGCSSCPPAEKWLGELRADPDLWRRFVPVAFHVNYWDHLGWRDALASKAFTARQHAYAAAWNASTVYTPGFVRNGAEWRPRGTATDGLVGKSAGELTLTHRADGACEIRFVPAAPAPANAAAFDVSVALLGGGIVSKIRAGENSGRELRHEFVALRLETAPLRRAADGAFTATVTLAPPNDPRLPAFARRALAAWVTPRDHLAPLQAVGGWLP
jgi:hypothetical protein